jgi:hypothetical protein
MTATTECVHLPCFELTEMIQTALATGKRAQGNKSDRDFNERLHIQKPFVNEVTAEMRGKSARHFHVADMQL